MTTVSEEDLHAFVDDRLDPARRSQVLQALEADPVLARRVADWREQATELRRALRPNDLLERDLILARLAGRRANGGQRPAQWAIAASVVAAVLLGGAGGWLARGPTRPTEIARLGVEAASAFQVFGNDPVQTFDVSASDRAELISRLAQKLGRHVTLPDLSAQGYSLIGGRVLSAMYGPAAILVYRNEAGDRVTLYVQPMRIGAPAGMQKLPVQTVDGYAWISHQVGYTVMSDGDRAQLRSVADRMHAGTGS